jgi:hypothetical protein
MTNSNYIELNQLYEKYKAQGLHFEPLHSWLFDLRANYWILGIEMVNNEGNGFFSVRKG